MFKNLFRKKTDRGYDPLHIKVTDLAEGYIFEYDLKQWEVVGEATYDWGDNYFSKELKITDGTDTFFLSVEEDDELEIVLYKKIRIGQIDGDIEQQIKLTQKPPSTIHFQSIAYIRENESPGYYNPSKNSSEWIEFINWQYYDDSGEKAISIEQWGENEFEASEGKIVKPFEISNILPRE